MAKKKLEATTNTVKIIGGNYYNVYLTSRDDFFTVDTRDKSIEYYCDLNSLDEAISSGIMFNILTEACIDGDVIEEIIKALTLHSDTFGSSQTEPNDNNHKTTNNNTEVQHMSISLRQVAKEATTLSELMNGRDKVDVEFIIEKYPNGISLNAVDLLTSEGKQYPIFTFEEDETAFFFGGTVLMNIVSSWLKALNTTDIADVSEALASEPVKVVLGTAKTKSGKNVTTVTVID